MRSFQRRIRVQALLTAAVVGWSFCLLAPSASAQSQDFNGLWWNPYNAFQPSPEVAPGFWWDHYQPPARPYWNGPYYTVDHWDPYIPRPVNWSPLIYNFANYPPQTTRPSGFYAQFSPGPTTWASNAWVFWQYIWPTLLPETQNLLSRQLGLVSEPFVAESPQVFPPVRAKQYVRKYALGPLRGMYWEEHLAPLHELPGPRVIRGDHLGFTQYYRPAGHAKWVLHPTRTPKRVIEPAKENKDKEK